MTATSPRTLRRRSLLLLLGLAAAPWPARSEPRPLQKPEVLADADGFVIVNGWVLPRALLDPGHAA